MTWHPRQLAEQTGRTFVVTGANSGIGLAAARDLVGRGAHVVLAVRDTAKGEQTAARLGFGPANFAQHRGRPELLYVYASAKDPATAARPWQLTEHALGTPLPI